jgi:hypothetical protein
MTCVQVFTLIDLEAKRTLEEENRKLSGLFPNAIKVARPKAEAMLEELKIMGIVYHLVDGNYTAKFTGVGPLQADILHITRCDEKLVSSKHIVETLNIAEAIDKESFHKAVMQKFLTNRQKEAP